MNHFAWSSFPSWIQQWQFVSAKHIERERLWYILFVIQESGKYPRRPFFDGHCRGSETCSRNLFSFFWLLFILWTPVAQTDHYKILTRNKRHLSKRLSRTIEVTGLDFWDASVRDRLSRTDAVGSFMCYVQSDESKGVMMMMTWWQHDSATVDKNEHDYNWQHLRWISPPIQFRTNSHLLEFAALQVASLSIVIISIIITSLQVVSLYIIITMIIITIICR